MSCGWNGTTCRVVEHAVAWFKASSIGGALLVDRFRALKPWPNCSCAHVSKGYKSRYSVAATSCVRAKSVFAAEGVRCRNLVCDVCPCQIAFACVCVRVCRCSSRSGSCRTPILARARCSVLTICIRTIQGSHRGCIYRSFVRTPSLKKPCLNTNEKMTRDDGSSGERRVVKAGPYLRI
jgi:hypothetical protein